MPETTPNDVHHDLMILQEAVLELAPAIRDAHTPLYNNLIAALFRLGVALKAVSPTGTATPPAVDLRNFAGVHLLKESALEDPDYHVLKPASPDYLKADLEWLASPGPKPRRAYLAPEHANWLLERLRIPRGQMIGSGGLGGDPQRATSALVRALTEADLAKLKSMPPQPVNVVRLRDEMDQVLDDYRKYGRECGVQVFATDHVIAWVGDIERIADSGHVRLRGTPTPTPVFFKCTTSNAIEDAAKWLRSQLP